MMEQYVDEFAKSLIGRITICRGAPAQMHFGFDCDYVYNPQEHAEEMICCNDTVS